MRQHGSSSTDSEAELCQRLRSMVGAPVRPPKRRVEVTTMMRVALSIAGTPSADSASTCPDLNVWQVACR